MNDSHFMRAALECADIAASNNEVPVGAVIVAGGEIIARASNAPIMSCDPSAHAEILALRAAGHRLKNYRLPDCTIYVTIEPCSMCLGALIHARIARVVFGAREPKAGAVMSNTEQLDSGVFNHRIEILGGVLEEECARRMSGFFERRRALKAQLKRQRGLAPPA